MQFCPVCKVLDVIYPPLAEAHPHCSTGLSCSVSSMVSGACVPGEGDAMTRPGLGGFASWTALGLAGFGTWKGSWAFIRKLQPRCHVLEDQTLPRSQWGLMIGWHR